MPGTGKKQRSRAECVSVTHSHGTSNRCEDLRRTGETTLTPDFSTLMRGNPAPLPLGESVELNQGRIWAALAALLEA
jgi:hypothetical protein